MSHRPILRMDWCSHKAAVYAVKHWHYAKSMPMGRLVKVGVWENDRYIGCVVFAQGNNQHQGKAFDLGLFEVCELIRIALCHHQTPVSRIVSIALSFLKKFCPGIQLVVSYADPAQGHHGGIYQAGNWTYVGLGGSGEAFYDSSGKRLHSRSHNASGAAKIQFGQFSHSSAIGVVHRVRLPRKYKYLMALNPSLQKRISLLAKPYPKCERSAENGTAVPPAGGGVIPTRSLQSS